MNSCLAFIPPKQERVSTNPSEIRRFLEDRVCTRHSLSSFITGGFFLKERLQRLPGSRSADVCSAASDLPGQECCSSWRSVTAELKLNAKLGDFQSPRIIAKFLLLSDLCYATGGSELESQTNMRPQQQSRS